MPFLAVISTKGTRTVVHKSPGRGLLLTRLQSALWSLTLQFCVVGFFSGGSFALAAPLSERGEGMVSSDHHAASIAGAEALSQSGNAVDAAVAAALAAGVVQPAGSGLGGGGFALIVQPDGRASVLDFREVAPAGSTRTMFLDQQGKPDPMLSRSGGLAVGVPGEPRGLALLMEEYGALSFAQVVRPARRLAVKGFQPGLRLIDALSTTSHPEIREAFTPDGARVDRSSYLKRPDLGRTLARWSRTRGEDFYEGRVAGRVLEAVTDAGGLMRSEDLAGYAPRVREPLVGTYRGYTIVTMPPPSSGGVVLLQALSVLEGHDLASMGHNSSAYVHLVVEVLKHGFADRAHHMGDPDYVKVPVGRLLSGERKAEIADAYDAGRTHPPDHYGKRIAVLEDEGTQHISVLDSEGMAVALTTTINTSFGSGLFVDGAGVILNNEMDDFAAAPGVPNAYGLIGNEANAVAPGKRPLSSMSPTVILDPSGRPFMVVGASGGSHIISGTLQVILSVLDFGMDPQEAVAAARFHHQWQPETLWIEPGFPKDVRDALEQRGHVLYVRPDFSSVQAVVRGEGTELRGGADPRKGGWPAGVYAPEG